LDGFVKKTWQANHFGTQTPAPTTGAVWREEANSANFLAFVRVIRKLAYFALRNFLF
jgi:hypothetical protein